ncbi:hypothetical protein ACT4UT_05155 [Bacillus sp. B-TM1]
MPPQTHLLAKFIPYPFDKNVSVPEWIDANNIETVFYQALAFIILFIITKIALSSPTTEYC